MNQLSVIIITKNESKDIKNCLESVKWADEIIIFDAGSSDNTVEICKQYTDHIFVTDWPGFGPQKNRALNAATNPWILSIDADERVSPELATEIQKIINQPTTAAGYRIRRLSTYCGKRISYGDWRNDYCLRLFLREKGQFNENLVHESVQITGAIKTLQSPLYHLAFHDTHEVISKLNQYSSLSAQQLHEKGRKSSLVKALIHSGWTFFRGYILKLGFLDGRAGFLLAVSNAQGCYYRYVKLLFLNQLS